MEYWIAWSLVLVPIGITNVCVSFNFFLLMIEISKKR